MKILRQIIAIVLVLSILSEGSALAQNDWSQDGRGTPAGSESCATCRPETPLPLLDVFSEQKQIRDWLSDHRPCNRYKLFTEFSPEQCSAQSYETQRFFKQCEIGSEYKAPSGFLSTALKREQYRFLIARELQLLSRISQGSPGYEERWRNFIDKWEARYVSDPELLRLDQSDHKIANRSLRSIIHGLSERKTELEASFETLAKNTGIQKVLTYALFRSAILLSTLKSDAAQKWALRLSKGDKKLAQTLLTQQRDFIYGLYPELRSQPAILKETEKTLHLQMDLEKVSQSLFAQENGQELTDEMRIRKINEELSRPPRSSSAISKVPALVSSIENRFAHATDEILKKNDQWIHESESNPSELFQNDALLLSAMQSLNRDSGNLEYQTLGVHYCQLKRSEKRTQTLKTWALVIGGGIALATGVGALGLMFVGSAGVLASTLGTTGLVVGTVQSGALLNSSIQNYHHAEDAFYRGKESMSEVEKARKERNREALWTGLMVGGATTSVVRKTAVFASASRSTVGATRTGAQAVTWADHGMFATTIGLQVKERNWLGLGFVGAGTAIALRGVRPGV